jgi:hypothetical protein
MTATENLFESHSGRNPAFPVCTSVVVDIEFDSSELTWVEVPVPAFNEVWYRTTVPYSFTFEVEPDITLIPQSEAQAQLTVREIAGVYGSEWRLVEWHDLAGETVSASTMGVATWGAVKSLFIKRPRLLPLTTRTAILNNIEYAYNKRDIGAMDDLLSQNLTFFFAPGDVGGNIPEKWGRVDEYGASSRLFNSNHQPDPPADPVCRTIRLDIAFDDETEWVLISPEDFPGETWFMATVFYTFTFEIEPDVTLIPLNGTRAQFTVRDIAVGEDELFELVEWRDLGGQTDTASSDAATQAVTWGAVKAMYQ